MQIQTGEQPDDPEFASALTFCTIDQMLASFVGIPYGGGARRANLNVGAVLGTYQVFDEFHEGPPWARLLAQINYLGKRGGFFQLQAPAVQEDELGPAWVSLTAAQERFFRDGTLQMLDDCGARLTWEHVDIYSAKSIKLGAEERVLRPVVLPCRLARSSYRYSLYERIDP